MSYKKMMHFSIWGLDYWKAAEPALAFPLAAFLDVKRASFYYKTWKTIFYLINEKRLGTENRRERQTLPSQTERNI